MKHNSCFYRFFIPVIFMLFSFSVHSQAPIPIALNDHAEGAISFIGQFITYTACVEAGDSINVVVVRTSGNFWPRIQVFQDGDTLADEYTSPTVEVVAQISQTGNITIRISDGFIGNHTGDFNLYINRRNNPPGALLPICNFPNPNINITYPGQIISYLLNISQPGLCQITLSRISGDLWPELLILDLDHSVLISDYSSTLIVLNVNFQQAGCYTILCRDGFIGNHLGEMQLLIQSVPPGGAVCGPPCTIAEQCTDNVDNDGNGLTDCADQACQVCTSSISVAASSTSICSGQNVTFTATPTNGGATPMYQWYQNDNPVGTNSPTFSTTNLTNNAQVYCSMTSNDGVCVSPTSASSNSITITVNPTLTSSVSVVASSTSICSGQNVTFTATPTNGGAAPVYQWYVNTISAGGNSTFSTTTLTNGAQVYCSMTSNADCVSPTTASSNPVSIEVISLPQPNLVLTNDTIFATNYNGSGYFYSWYFNNNFVSIEPYLICEQFGNGQYYLIVTSNGCTSTSDEIDFECMVSAQNTVEEESRISVYPNPVTHQLTIEGNTIATNSIKLVLYNVLGQLVDEKEIKVTDFKFNTTLDFEGLANGIYIVAVSLKNEITTFKVQKQE